ncbi:MAG: hypothetical protein LBC85_05680 [Fibromonadaceae bacterium]|jgi:hypothetical protein|nr:hypothetical protein [Fibromonadaceae bacterium]
MENTSDSLYYLWFIILVAILVVLFVAKLKFDEIFEKRQERRRLLTYSKTKLMPTEEGQARSLKIKRIRDLKP